MKDWIEIAHEMKAIAVTGRLGIGKTCLSYTILEKVKKHKPVYIFKHPRPEIITARGYKILYEFGELEHLEDCAVWLDEPQLFIKRHEKKSNVDLENLLTLCRQRNITLLLSTADTRFITRGIEFYIDSWCILDIAVDLVKQGSIISKIIKRNALITAQQFRLPLGFYYFYSREYYKLNGLKKFLKPKWFNQKFSKPFKGDDKNGK